VRWSIPHRSQIPRSPRPCARDFEKAAALILADPARAAEVRRIFNLPANLGIGPAFLAIRMQKLYATQAISTDALSKAFLVDSDNFVWLL
jgi:hypothetical protein